MSTQASFRMPQHLTRILRTGVQLLAVILITTWCTINASAQPDGRRPITNEGSRPTDTMPKRIGTKSGDAFNKPAYGILTMDLSDIFFTDGLVKFDLTDASFFEHIKAFGDYEHYISAAAFANGYYYIERTVLLNDQEVPDELLRYDIDKDEVIRVGSFTGFDRFINDMTYDYATATMYAISRPSNNNSALYTINLQTAEAQKVFDFDQSFFTLACTYGGQLYAISFEGDLYTIDKNAGTVEKIGNTGYYPQYYQSMEFDHSDGTLYWAACLNESAGVPNCVMRVDTNTGQGTELGTLGDQGEIVGLYIPFSASAKGTPAEPTDFSVTPGARGEKSATLNWSNPTVTFDGQPLSEINCVKIYRDKELIATLTDMQCGETASYTDNITDEKSGSRYHYTISAYNEVGPGAEASNDAFIGKDIPSEVYNLQLTAIDKNTAKLTWDAAELGKDGGYVDEASLHYQVTRLNDNQVVANNLQDCSFIENNIVETSKRTYEVRAISNEGSSEGVKTSTQVFGPYLTMPYIYDFTSTQSPDVWTIVNTRIDDGGWLRSTGMSANKMQHQPALYGDSNDWLISYYAPFKADTYYRADYDVKSYGSDLFEFYLLDKMNIDEGQWLYTDEIEGQSNKRHKTFIFRADKTGDLNFAIRAASPMRSDWIELLNVSVREAEMINLSATGIKFDEQPMEGKPASLKVTVYNVGVQSVDCFTINLKDESGNVLATTESTESLALGESKDIDMSWTPAQAGKMNVCAEVLCNGDSSEEDNTTALVGVDVRLNFKGEVVSIGTESTSTSNSSPFDFFRQHAAALNIYSADEVRVKSGNITQIAYLCDAQWQNSSAKDVPVKVYMKNTDLTNTEGGWIPEDELTLVYDGTIDVEEGYCGELTLKLDKPFAYDGKNLAVLTTINSDEYFSYIYFTQYTSPLPDNAAYLWGDYYDAVFDFTQEGYVDWYKKNTSIILYVENDIIDGITAPTQIHTHCGYEVYDLSGRKVSAGTTDNAGEIDKSSLNTGIYVAKYHTNAGAISEKICIE